MSFRSEIYGLVIDSDVELGGIPADPSGPIDVRVGILGPPAGAPTAAGGALTTIYSSEEDPSGTPALVVQRSREDGATWLRYAEGIRFRVSGDAGAISCDWDPPLTTDDAVSFLLGPVLGLVLRRRGVLALHASAVVIDGRAWAFVGPGGAGKSTLAAAFSGAGIPVVAEDVLALRPSGDRWSAWPAYDHVRLWTDSPALTLDAARRLPPLSAVWDKRALALAPGQRTSSPFPFAGWFLLEREPGVTQPVIEPLVGVSAITALIAHSYVNYLLDARERSGELAAIAAAARGVRAYRLIAGEGREGLRATVDAVTACARR